MRRDRIASSSVPITFTRADPEALRRFDPSTRVCTLNCGPHRDDPRSEAERKLLCRECMHVRPGMPELDKLRAQVTELRANLEGLDPQQKLPPAMVRAMAQLLGKLRDFESTRGDQA